MEDANPFAKRSTPSAASAKPLPQAALQATVFGLIGDRHTSQEQPSQFGWQITRYFGSGVQYRKPTSLARGWSRIDDYSYQLIWPEAVPESGPMSLDHWVARVATLPKTVAELLSSHNNDLIQLDGVIDAYLEAVEQLHRSNVNQGLIHPKAVLLLNTGTKLEAVLPDAGFTWRGEFGAPTWLSNHPGQGRFFSSAATDRQLLTQLKSPADHAADVQLAAQLIRYVLLGERFQSPPVRDEGFWAELARPHGTVTELRQALQQHKPSAGYRDLIAEKPKEIKLIEDHWESTPTSKAPIVLAVLLVLMLVVGGGAFLILPKALTVASGKGTRTTESPVSAASPTPPSATMPTTGLPPETIGLLNEGERLQNGYEKPPEDIRIRQQLDQDRVAYVKRLNNHLNNIWDAYGEDNNSARALSQLRPLVEQLKKLSKLPAFKPDPMSLKKEQACIAFAVELLQQL